MITINVFDRRALDRSSLDRIILECDVKVHRHVLSRALLPQSNVAQLLQGIRNFRQPEFVVGFP